MNDVRFSDILNIYNEEISKRVKNKRKIEEFERYKISYLISIYDVLKSGNYDVFKYNIFLIKEPKYRIIMSCSIYDKVINHFITRYVLEPKLAKYLDIRNCATRKGMGSSYAIDLVKKYIEEEKRESGEFYVLKLDISKYFYSIDHEVLKELLKDKLDEVEYKFMKVIIDSTDCEYVNEKIVKLKENEVKRNNKRKDEIESLPLYNKGKGLSIGMMTNQFLAVLYLHKLHNYIIHKLKIKHLVVYMDDYILMHKDKEYLKKCLMDITRILKEEFKLDINKKKTCISSIKQGFVFLEYRFRVVNNKTIIKLRKDTINKAKKNIKKNKYLFERNEISFQKMFSSINNYKNSFKYDKYRMSNMLDKIG